MLQPQKNQKLSEVVQTKTFFDMLSILRLIYGHIVVKKKKSPKTPKMSLYLTQKFVIFAKSFFHKKFPRRFSEASKSVLISDVHMPTKSFENFARKNYFFLEK